MTLSARIAQASPDVMTQKLEALFHDYDRADCPGACVMVIQNGKILAAKGYGLADLETKTPCATNTNFRLASVTKQFTAMAVMILAERKKLSLDERLTDFFPEFPEYGKLISVRQLLSHTSGLDDYEDVIPKGTEIPVLDRDVLRLLMKQNKTYFPPGTKYRYSNSAYALLALMVEARSGSTFAQFLRKSIFQPLKMSNTLAYEQGISVVPNRAYGYSAKDGSFVRTDQSLTSSVLGDGGVYSSVSDLYKWDQALYTSKLVSPRMLQLAFTSHIETDHSNTGYGFGWMIGAQLTPKAFGLMRSPTTSLPPFPTRSQIALPRPFALEHCLFEQVFDLAVDAAEFVLRPGLQIGPESGINPQQERFAGGHASGLRVEGAGVDHRMHLSLAAEHHHQIADHRRAAFVVQFHYPLFRQFSQRHVHHADGAVNDLLARRNDCFGLLPAQHRLGDLRRVSEVRQPRFFDLHSGLVQADLQFLFQGLRDLIHPAAERDLVLLAMVVGVGAGQVAQGGLALHAHVVLIIIHIEDSLRRVLHFPHHDRPDLDGIAALVVDLEFLAVEIPRAQRNFEARELLPLRNCAAGLSRGKLGFEFSGPAQRAGLVWAIRVKRIPPMKPRLPHRPLVCAKQHQNPRLIRLQRKKADQEDDAQWF